MNKHAKMLTKIIANQIKDICKKEHSRPVSLERTAYEAVNWMVSGNLAPERVPNTLTDKSGLLCSDCLCRQCGLC